MFKFKFSNMLRTAVFFWTWGLCFVRRGHEESVHVQSCSQLRCFDFCVCVLAPCSPFLHTSSTTEALSVSILAACRACSPWSLRGPDTLKEITMYRTISSGGKLEAKVRGDPTKTSTEKKISAYIYIYQPRSLSQCFLISFFFHLFKCLSNFRKFSSNEFHGNYQMPCYTFLAFSGPENTAVLCHRNTPIDSIDLGWYTIVPSIVMSERFPFFCHSE